MFTPSKLTDADLIDVTVLNTPQPQATSTVQRKNTFESKVPDKNINEPINESIRCKSMTEKCDESSLGILNDMSSFLAEVSGLEEIEKCDENNLNSEHELVRKLLQRCSDLKTTFTIHDINKENDVNIQNLSDNISPALIDSNQIIFQNENSSHSFINKASSVIFEPNEITARSSGLSRNSEKCLSSLSSSKNLNTITFDTTTAEFMAQFSNEDFRPASEMASQFIADEASWQQNYSYALPTTSTGKEHLDLSCFSGVIGELDISVESCAGRKVSIGEFFRRKCGNFGELSDNAVERPSLGLSVNSPKKKDQIIPLVDSTIVTEDFSIGSIASKDKTQNMQNTMKDIEEHSVMSLTSIAQALQDIDNGTPRRLVDQLIMAKKKRKSLRMQEENLIRDTYTLMPSNRKSMPITPSRDIDNFKKDIGLLNLTTKLSLDSKIINETIGIKHSIPRMLSFDSNSGVKANIEVAYQELKKEINNEKLPSSHNEDFKLLLEDSKLTLPNYIKKEVSPCISKINTIINHEKQFVKLEKKEIEKKDDIKKENISYKDKLETSIQDCSKETQSYVNNVIIGKNTEELCNCIVGLSRETDIELLNKSDKWMLCSLNINQIQGDKEIIQLTSPNNVVLVKPNSEKFFKIIATVVKMSKPIITVVNITVLDVVAKFEWTMKHIICFKPEEINISVSNPLQKKELDFQYVVENSVTILPITIKNKNNVDVLIKFFISQHEPAIFSLENSAEPQHIILKTQDTYIINIQCKGIIQKNSEIQQQSLQRFNSTLIIQAENNSSEENILIQEVPLVVQVGTFKIEVIETDLPLIIPNKQSKSLSVINLGTIPIVVLAAFSEDIDSKKNSKYFSIEPENIHMQPKEIGRFFITYKQEILDIPKIYTKIKLTAAGNVHHYVIIGESSVCTERENENFPRCETPQYVSSVSSPSSPHSMVSSKSSVSGRNSSLSSVSGSTVAGDKIPIKTTHAALSWNSLKIGKSEIKEFTIRNTSNNKIKIQATISDSEKNFRFLRERETIGTTIVLALQGSESRTLSVVFSPHHIGAASGKIIFRHYQSKKEDSESLPSRQIFLYGYGGYSKVEISEVFKDTNGKMWLSFGMLNSENSLNAKIKLQNTGDLCSYVKIKLTPKAVYPTMISSWQVNPTELLLNPKEVQWVTLEFHPRKEDLALLQKSDVSHVGTLLITHGDEPTRLRIRRLYKKMKETGELNGNENETFRNIVHPICKVFSGEQLVSDVIPIRDSVQNFGDLCREIRQHEIMLTMEVCADETLTVLHDNPDESQMFYSLYSENSHVYDGNAESFLPSETLVENTIIQNDMNINNFMISPSIVVLTPPTRTEAIVTLKNSYTVAQPFETHLSNTEYLSIVPTEGMIPTRRDFQLKIQCKRKIERNFNAVLEIYTENNKFEVQIRVNVKQL
ncbi:uncharacterized protein LOC102681909 isoform X1 [Apis dorsata]|uniref:uncharacterized protein LOC102681909 isoform X1 n=1 Tax=Apis dorsata TaxID=7462 RepID=UPI0003DF54CF|nr:uncharacterized protein LOC102681909 isoform X1 [Apis dorsata]